MDGEIEQVATLQARIAMLEAELAALRSAASNVVVTRDAETIRHHQERLAAVGRLAAGIAHNFNNHLSTILPVLEMLREDGVVSRTELVDDAIHAGRRSADLVRQLLAFARRRDAGALVPVLFESVVERATAMCKALLDRTIDLTLESNAKDAFVSCDAGAIEQSVVNLVVNARDAIAESGRPKGHIRVSLAQESSDAGEACVLRIADDGAGMDPETRDRIFEPFFTTKDAGRGTGLGLSITYATIEAHGATIRCESTLGEGTTFVVRFPTTTAHAPSSPEAGVRDSLRSRPMRILLCDDDHGVREVVSTWLDHMGHDVEAASELDEALDALVRGPKRDLVLLDRSLVASDPIERIARIRAAMPGAFVVYFSGEDVPDDELVLVDHVLAKPPSAQSMDAMLEALFSE